MICIINCIYFRNIFGLYFSLFELRVLLFGIYFYFWYLSIIWYFGIMCVSVVVVFYISY